MITIEPTPEIISYYKSFKIDLGLFKQCYDLVKDSPFTMASSEVTYDNYIDSLVHAYIFSLAINLPPLRNIIRYDSIKNNYYDSHKGMHKLWYENGIIIYHELNLDRLEQFVRIKRVMQSFQIFESFNMLLNISKTQLPQDKKNELLYEHNTKASHFNAMCKPWNLFYVVIPDESISSRFYITQADCDTCRKLVSKDLNQYIIKNAIRDISNDSNYDGKFADTDSKVTSEETKYFKSLPYFDGCMRGFNAQMRNTGLEHIHDGDDTLSSDEIIAMYKDYLKNNISCDNNFNPDKDNKNKSRKKKSRKKKSRKKKSRNKNKS